MLAHVLGAFHFVGWCNMPEISEIAINALWLRERLVGKNLHSMKFHPHSRYYNLDIANGDGAFNCLAATIQNYQIVEVGTKGKLMWLHLHANQIPPMRAVVDKYLHISHAMSGGWRHPGGPWFDNDRYPHDAWSLVTQGGQETTYYDARKFGTLALLNQSEHQVKVDELGADVLQSCWEDLWGSFNHRAKLQSRKEWRTIRDLLLDQTIVSGIGNYLVSEILYRAEIKPSSTYPRLSTFQLERLFKAISAISNEAYCAGGCTLKSWLNPEGEKGNFQSQLKVYGKTHCPLRHEVLKVSVKGRSSYECPRCQR